MVRLRSAWPCIVGSLLAGKTFPARLKNDTLSVLVQNHAWAQELQLKKPVLIEQVNRVLGEDTVKELRFVVGTLPAVESDSVDPAPPRNDPGDASTPDPEGLASVADPETRLILRSIAGRIASLKR
jgi:predicted nucleic acid-binding Zn ribbon protein